MKIWKSVLTTLVVVILIIVGIIVFRKSPAVPTITAPTVTNGYHDDIPTIVDVCKGKNPPSDCVKG